MSRVCMITGAKPQSGQNRSHARNSTKRKFRPNLQTKRYFVESLGRNVKLTISAKGIRMIDKLGIEHFLTQLKGV